MNSKNNDSSAKTKAVQKTPLTASYQAQHDGVML